MLGWVWGAAACCAVLPDADVVGFALGIQYGDLLGHRGLTHSLPFAAGLSALVLAVGVRTDGRRLPAQLAVWWYLFLATASHGLLDALTDGGLGVAFFAPFGSTRYFFPVRPLAVSPIGIASFFSEWGWRVMRTEVLWIWAPAAALSGVILLWRYKWTQAGAR